MPSSFLTSSLGKKYLMALTGLMLLGFVVMHLLGNLTIFLGPAVLNGYAKKLLELGGLLWIARILLLAAVILHVWLGIQLAVENRHARRESYAFRKYLEATPASRSMAVSGLLILAFIVYHLLHFTFGVTHPEISHRVDSLGRHDVYTMVVLSFRELPVVISYVIAMALLCLHLLHGAQSTFQSLGLNGQLLMRKIQKAGAALAILIFLGYISIPVACLTGVVKAAGSGL